MKRTALVTGAAHGIGEAIARRLAADGLSVAVCDLDAAGQKVAKEIGGVFIRCDVGGEGDVKAAFEKARRQLGPVAVLVNNAGVVSTTPFRELSAKDWDRTMAINLRGAFLSMREVLADFEELRWGRVVNISSLAGRSGGLLVGADYSASKGGLIALTKTFAKVIAPLSATANAVCPGTTRTRAADAFGDDGLAKLVAAIPLGRLGEPEDVASLVAYLASEEAGYITGATVDINGGLFMG